MTMKGREYYNTLSRKELQTLAKQHGIKANSKNVVLIEELLKTELSVHSPEDIVEDHVLDLAEKDVKAATTTPKKVEEIAPNVTVNTPGSVDKSASKLRPDEVLEKPESSAAAPAKNPSPITLRKPIRTPKTGKSKDFRKIHEKLFSAQKSIADHYRSRMQATPLVKKSKASTPKRGPTDKKGEKTAPLSTVNGNRLRTNRKRSSEAVTSKEGVENVANGSLHSSKRLSRCGPKQRSTPLSQRPTLSSSKYQSRRAAVHSASKPLNRARKAFDLQASLKRPVTWEMKKGPLASTPFSVTKENKAPASTNARTPTMSAARPTKASLAARATNIHRPGPKSMKGIDQRGARRERISKLRSNKKSSDLMKRRSIVRA